MEDGPCIIVVGTLDNGFRFIGLYENVGEADDAANYHFKHEHYDIVLVEVKLEAPND